MKKYILRTMDKDGRSYEDFQWNLEIGGETVAPDWDESPRCGNGLHGFLNGQGDGSLANWDKDALWAVVSTQGDVVDLNGEVKFERGTMEFVGEREAATKFLEGLGICDAVIGATATAGDYGTATAGDYGTATAGYYGVISIVWHDGTRPRIAIGYVGEGGIEPNVAYCVKNGELVPTEPTGSEN